MGKSRGKGRRYGRRRRRKSNDCFYITIFTAVVILLISMYWFRGPLYLFLINMKSSEQETKIMYNDIEEYTKTILSFGIRSHPDSTGLKQTREFLQKEMRDIGLETELHESTSPTPFLGDVKFVNILGWLRNNPSSNEYVILAAHYESKYFKEFDFLGATDSAVPVAMCLHLAKLLASEKIPINLLVILFDGEESFGEWSDTDSLYGSKALAKFWKEENYLSSKNIKVKLLMLLDLIGDKNPQFVHFSPLNDANPQSSYFYNKLCDSENKEYGRTKHFTKRVYGGLLGDDHEPFVDFGFPIVHLIPIPFPKEWHKVGDNLESVDFKSVISVQRVLWRFFKELS